MSQWWRKINHLVKLNFHISLTVALKRKTKSFMLLGINFCVLLILCFLRAQIKAIKAVSFSKRGKSSSLSVKHPGVAAYFPSDRIEMFY